MVLSLTPEAESGEMVEFRFPFDNNQPLYFDTMLLADYQNLDLKANLSRFQC